MKEFAAASNVEGLSVINVSEGSIKNVTKAYRVLSSAIYKDKITAVIRELSCNADDAHIEAGNPEPFIVHLPSQLEPYFSVKDNGIGMSDETVKQVIVTYFESLKNHTDELTGGLGLGCKSPFAYTDAFTATSRYEGMERVYTCFMNARRVPNVALLSEAPTAERNGVEFTVPVRVEDIREFRIKAQDVFRFFKRKPIVQGASDFKFKELGKAISGSNWQVCEGIHAPMVRMGSIAYPIDNSMFKDKRSSLMYIPILFEAPIGWLDFQPGREELSYDPVTTSRLQEIIDTCVNEINDEIAKEFADCDTEFQIRLRAIELGRKSNHYFRSIVSQIPIRGVADAISPYMPIKTEKTDYVLSYGYAFQKSAKPSYIEVTSKHGFVYDDSEGKISPTSINKRLRQAITNKKFTKILYAEKPDHEAYKKLGITFVGVSTLETVASVKKSRPPLRLFTLNRHTNADTWDETSDTPDGGYYMVLKNRTTRSGFVDFRRAAINTGIIKQDQKIYGVALSLEDEYKDNSKWINLEEYIKDTFTNMYRIDSQEHKSICAMKTISNERSINVSRVYRHVNEQVIPNLDANSSFVSFWKNMNPKMDDTYFRNIESITGYLSMHKAFDPTYYGFDRDWKNIQTEWPLLKFLLSSREYRDTVFDWSDFTHYLNK